MSPKVAQRVFLLFNLVAVLVVAYVVRDIVNVTSELAGKQPVIPLDTGIGYLLLMSVFWLLSLVQFVGRRNKQHFVIRWSNQLVIGWFMATLLLAYFIPALLQERLQQAGYIPCDDPQVVSRISRGASLIFLHGQAFSASDSQPSTHSAVCELFASSLSTQ
ncbi:hypothetical protein [Rheinheimera nanhaiensis]|uniref:hypothetical protein n=1 Tax=Rheinheimera nanhaiensis TaxID=1163621 RepID=UPI00058F7E25|nr:hypothetical protein [Rheinheimera nanhaiensis]